MIGEKKYYVLSDGAILLFIYHQTFPTGLKKVLDAQNGCVSGLPLGGVERL